MFLNPFCPRVMFNSSNQSCKPKDTECILQGVGSRAY